MIAKTRPGTAGERGATAGLARRPGVRGHRSGAASRNERVRLITFVWSGRTGAQPVILADRSWLQ
jgi:hypothetical protein